MIPKRWVRALSLSIVAMMILAACGGAGAGGNGDASPPDLSSIDFVMVSSREGMAALSDLPAHGGATAIVMPFIAYFAVLADWTVDQPSSYTYGSVTVSWNQNGSTWCWTISGVDEVAFEIEFCITDTGTDLQITVHYNDELFLSGTISYDGSVGTVSLFSSGSPLYSYSWQPSAIVPYDWNVRIEDNSDPDSDLIIDFTDDGSQGEYYIEGTDIMGAWPEAQA